MCERLGVRLFAVVGRLLLAITDIFIHTQNEPASPYFAHPSFRVHALDAMATGRSLPARRSRWEPGLLSGAAPVSRGELSPVSTSSPVVASAVMLPIAYRWTIRQHSALSSTRALPGAPRRSSSAASSASQLPATAGRPAGSAPRGEDATTRNEPVPECGVAMRAGVGGAPPRGAAGGGSVGASAMPGTPAASQEIGRLLLATDSQRTACAYGRGRGR